MLRSLMMFAAVAAIGCSSSSVATADPPVPGQEVTLTGTLMCGKCKLKTEGFKDCVNALQVKDGDKTVTYFLQDQGNSEDYHECGKGEKPGVTVVGQLTEKDGKKWIKPTKVDVKK